MVEREFENTEGAEAVGFFHSDFSLVIDTFDHATGKLLLSLEVIENQTAAVPAGNRTDSLSSAVNNMRNLEEFNQRYEALMRYYGVKPQHTNPVSPNENGDAEQNHHRFKKAVEQGLLLRGSRSEAECGQFLKDLIAQRKPGGVNGWPKNWR